MNNRSATASSGAYLPAEQAEKLLLSGVMLRDPASFLIRGNLHCGNGCRNSTLTLSSKVGVTLGHRVKIGAGRIIKTALLATTAKLALHSVVEDAHLEAGFPHHRSVCSPASRRGAKEAGAHVGNFAGDEKRVSVKVPKAGHLTHREMLKLATT